MKKIYMKKPLRYRTRYRRLLSVDLNDDNKMPVSDSNNTTFWWLVLLLFLYRDYK